MPTYSYKCGSCGTMFELILSMENHSKPESEPCPYCRETRVFQTITTANPLADPYSLGRYRTSDEWNGFLTRLKKKNPGSNINV